jgi:signal transduction histidine kinase/CheY-like chemotaxis protein
MWTLLERGNDENLRRQQSVLAKFGELALRSQSLDDILTEACRLVGEALGTDLAKVVELQADGETLLVRAGVGWKPGVVGVATITASDDTSEAVALKTGKPMISPNILTETRFKYPHFLVDNGVMAVANVLVLGGKDRPPFGILQVDSRRPRQFTSDDTTFLQGYANLIAAAVDRLRLVDELRLSEAQLRHSQKLEAIGRLAAGVAHDFNNILQSISGGLELVLEDVKPGTLTHEVASLALTSAGRGASITQHLLSYARKQALQPKTLRVGLFLAEMRLMLSSTLGQNIAIQLQTDPTLPGIRVDPGQLQTALLNLSINAAHAMPQGGTLTLEGRKCAEADQKCVIIAITDTGIGMDQATLAQAAEPFFTTKGVAGSGLGLSMVQGFVEQSGGAMRIESSTGKGTRVELQLPAVDPVDGDPVEQRTAPMRLQGSGRVLLVDDAADVLLITAAFLRRVGFTVAKAENGPKALSLLASEGFDVLLTDYAMVELNGVALIQQARKTRPGLPAVIITGYAEVSDSLPGGVAVLGKPFSRQSLVDALTDAIGKGPNH